MMRHGWRIRSYLVMLVLVIVLPVTGVLAYTLYSNLQHELNDAQQLSLALAKITAVHSGRYVESRQNVLARIAERPQVRRLDPENCDPILKDFRDFEAGFTNIVVLDRDGLVVCSAVPMSKPISYAEGDNYQRVKATDAFVVGKPSYGKISRKWILPLAYPIHDQRDRFNGLIGAAIDLVKHQPLHGLDVLPAGTRAALVNSDGIIIAHSNDADKRVGQPVVNQQLRQLLVENVTGQARLPNIEGEEMLIGFSAVPGSDWHAVVGIPTASIMGKAFNTALTQALLILTIVLLASALAFILARRIEKPIRSIADTASAVAGGELHSRLTTTGPSEIAAVAGEFNHMLDLRAQSEQQLREKAEHLRLAMDAANMASWEWHIKHDRIQCSDNAWPMFGLRQDQAFDQFEDFMALIHADDREQVQHAVRQTIESGMSYSCEFRVIWPDGSIHWLAARGQLIRDINELPERMLGICMDITERMHSDQQIRYLASHDSLTDLFNRREFEQRLQIVLNRAISKTMHHAVLYLDLDQFKVVNDTCGHVAGDELLRQLASLLNKRVRDADTLARLGGDEFVVLLENCPLEHAQRIAEELRQTVLDFHFAWQQHGFKIGVSIGLVPITLDPDNHNTPSLEVILSAADAACFVAKDQGRNRVHVHHEEDTALAMHHGQMEWITRIHSAFDEERFKLYCQTIAPVNASARLHCELLVRMQDESGQLIPPMAFIPAAERYGLMNRIDRWVIAETFKTLTSETGQQPFDYICNINVSATSLTDPDFLAFIRQQFADSPIAPGMICFEITETAAIANLPQAIRLIDVLKQIGCRIALDDFGSGMSSFSYLKNFSIDYLKIDGSFIMDVVDDPIDRAMIEAINKIGHVMNIATIAECVETREVLEQVTRLGVDFVQGFAIDRPVSFDKYIHQAGKRKI